MTTVHVVPDTLRKLYEVREWRNAAGLLSTACPAEWDDIINVLCRFRIPLEEFAAPSGQKTDIADRLDHDFYDLGWQERQFHTSILVDAERMEAPTHKVDCVKGRVALEIEWNNKDPFFDRDLNNFCLLFDLRAIDVGVIVTRCDELKDVCRRIGKKLTATATWMSKLVPKLEGGSGGGCPVLVFGITKELIVER